MLINSRSQKNINIKQLLIGLPRWLSGKESACRTEDDGSIPGSGRSSGGGNGTPLQNSCLGGLQSMGSHELDMTEMT